MTTDKLREALEKVEHHGSGIDEGSGYGGGYDPDASADFLNKYAHEIFTHLTALEAKTVDAENAHDIIRYLLPLAKGYVAANPGIRSTETIIEDAEAMIAEAGRGK